MRYIGNYSSWIDPLWEHKILTTDGQARPRDVVKLTEPEGRKAEEAAYEKYVKAGYDLNAVHWWIYEDYNLNINVTSTPWTTGKIHWWFSKLMPGQFMPMHSDPHVFGNNCNRYWIAMQDYIPGHIFVYNDTMIKDYKYGDVFQFEHEQDPHGAANISFVPRIIMQITEYVS